MVESIIDNDSLGNPSYRPPPHPVSTRNDSNSYDPRNWQGAPRNPSTCNTESESILNPNYHALKTEPSEREVTDGGGYGYNLKRKRESEQQKLEAQARHQHQPITHENEHGLIKGLNKAQIKNL